MHTPLEKTRYATLPSRRQGTAKWGETGARAGEVLAPLPTASNRTWGTTHDVVNLCRLGEELAKAGRSQRG